MLKTLVGLCENVTRVEDPVVKYTLILTAMKFAVDSGLNYAKDQAEVDVIYLGDELEQETDPKKKRDLERSISNSGKHVENLEKIEILMEDFFAKFGNWVSQPTYSPDHPVGAVQMEKSKEDFESLKLVWIWVTGKSRDLLVWWDSW